jgi:ABC-type sugar transport system ATPase subunit/ribose/xylose/arabinose/galactoside ABC-type transport system permease subunit
MSATIELTSVTKAFPGVVALQDVDLALRPGCIHALVGENGAGKSTLLNVLNGNLRPDVGSIRLDGQPVNFTDAHAARQLGVVTVPQEVDLFPDLTVAENLALEEGSPSTRLGWIDWRRQRQRAAEALALFGEAWDLDAPAAGLMPARRQMLLIAAALAQMPSVLILDEPTSSLSAAEARILFEHVRRCRERGAAVLYVSHRFEEIFALADEVTVLRDGHRVWHGSLADTSASHLIRLMVGRDVTAGSRRAAAEPGPVRLRSKGLTDAEGAFRDLSLDVRAGEVIGLYGLVGAGRSEWAQGVIGLRPLSGGEVLIDERSVKPHGPAQMARNGVAYVPEDRLRQGLCRGLSVRANAMLAALRQLATCGWTVRARETKRARAVVEQLSVRLRSVEQPAGTLSGGNQQKIVLGRWLERNPAVLLLDEPTRGIDVGAKEEIYALVRRLTAARRAVVFISSDLPEVLAQSDRVGVFREGRLVGFFDPRQVTAEEVAAAAVPGAHPPDAAVSHVERLGSSPSMSERPTGLRPTQPWGLMRLPREAALVLALVLLFAFVEMRSGRFLQPGNLLNLATATSLLSFCALGATLVLLAGGIDVSLGSLMALSAAVAGSLWERGQSPLLVFAVGLLIGAAGGFLNACLSLVGRVHPIVITLGTMSLYRGLALRWLGQDVQIPNTSREGLLLSFLGLPVLVWLGLAVALAVAVFLGRTVPGRALYAVGSNPAAARRIGISPARAWLVAFTLQGLLAGLAGLLYLARSGSLQPVSYEDTTLEAITAAVIGGVAITGGRGTVAGAVLGCLFLTSLTAACVFLGLPPTWQRTVVGLVMVTAVTLDTLWRRRTA